MAETEKTVLVVEDEPDTAEMFSEMLRLSNYRVVKCHGSTTAISTISEEKPDAVVLDIMMPDVSGIEVLRYMQRDPHMENIPVIIVSAKSGHADIQDGLDAGATFYLTKPVSFNDLQEAVANAIQSAQQRASSE